MSQIAQVLRQSCSHHPERESVARCPECGHTYCRECITDHAGRVICARCLEELRQAGPRSRNTTAELIKSVLGLGIGALLALIFYYALGWTLLQIPEKFHEAKWFAIDE